MSIAHIIDLKIMEVLQSLDTSGKAGRDLMQPAIGNALSEVGFQVDLEDSYQFLSRGLPVWRSKDTGEIEPTIARRKIDIVVYSEGSAVALIETESDLNDLRRTGVSSRSGHYDVFSIAKNSDGKFFDSYKSLERMAAAAIYEYYSQRSSNALTANDLTEKLEALHSDDVSVHNPEGLHLCLVSGTCRPMHREILRPRLHSLGASLICANDPLPTNVTCS